MTTLYTSPANVSGSFKTNDITLAIHFDSPKQRDQFLSTFIESASSLNSKENYQQLFQPVKNNENDIVVTPSNGQGTIGAYHSDPKKATAQNKGWGSAELTISFNDDTVASLFQKILGVSSKDAQAARSSGAVYFNPNVLSTQTPNNKIQTELNLNVDTSKAKKFK